MMKRPRESDFTEDQCDRIWLALSADRKRQLLWLLNDDEVVVGEYNDPMVFRDIIANHILNYVDFKTFMALRATCTYLHDTLNFGLYPPYQRIVNFIENVNTPMPILDMKELFWVYLSDTMETLELTLTERHIRTISEAKIYFDKYYHSACWVKLGPVYIRYPTGYMVKSGTSDVRWNMYFDGIERVFANSKFTDIRLLSADTVSIVQSFRNTYKKIH